MGFDKEFKGHKVRWMWLFKKIVREAPYARMVGAKIEKGCIITWEDLIVKMKFTKPHEDVTKLLPKRFDFAWQWLFRQCQEAWNDKMDISFADGRPVSIKQTKPGRHWDGEKFVEHTKPAE